MGTLQRFVILAICGCVVLPDPASSQGYYYENVNKYNVVNGRLQLVPPPPPPPKTTQEPTLIETIFPWMGDAYDSAKSPEEDAAILNSISDDPMTSSSNYAPIGDSDGSSWFNLPGFGSSGSGSEQKEVYEHPAYSQPGPGMYGNTNNMYYPSNNPMTAASQSQPMVMPGPVSPQQSPMPPQQGPMPPQHVPMSAQQGPMSPQHGGPMSAQQGPMPPQHGGPMSAQQGPPMQPPQQQPPLGPVYPGAKAPEPENHIQIPYTLVPNSGAAPMHDPEPQPSQHMPQYSPMYISEEPEKGVHYPGQQYSPYMVAQPQSQPQYPYNMANPVMNQQIPNNGRPAYNFHQQVSDSIPMPGPYGLNGFNQQMFPYPYSQNLPFDQGQGPNLPTAAEKPQSYWDMFTNFFTFGKRNDMEEEVLAIARSLEEDDLEETKAADSDGEADTNVDDDSSTADDNDESSSLKEAPSDSDATDAKPDKEFPCPKTGIWKWNGDVCIAVGPIPVWACRPNDLIVSGKIAICRNKIYFSPQKIIQKGAAAK